MIGKLDIIIGPMFSGKSCELIRRIRLLKILEKPYLVIKPKIDNRYSYNNVIETHNNDTEHCIVIDKLIESYGQKYDLADTIFIDEAQFFPNLKEYVLTAIESDNKNVIITGLDGDYLRKPFGQVLELIPYADFCIKQKALCKICKDGTPGIFTLRTCDNNKQILVGSTNYYLPVCRKHYNEKIK